MVRGSKAKFTKIVKTLKCWFKIAKTKMVRGTTKYNYGVY